MNLPTYSTVIGVLIVLLSGTALAQHEGHNMSESMAMPEDYSSPPAPVPEGQSIRKYAIDDEGTGATNFGVAPVHDNMLFYTFRADRFEYRSFDDGEVLLWDVQGWIGRDYNKLYFESEGEYSLDEDSFESVQTELLYGRAISSFWDFRAGLRYDFEPSPERAFAVVGVQGLAPQWFEVDANLYLSEDGDLSFGMEAEYDILLTQRLVLQPRMELEIAAQDVEEYGTYAGFTGVELGLRLRYEYVPNFAPYVGVGYERKIGETGRMAREEGENPGSTSLLLGVSFWF